MRGFSLLMGTVVLALLLQVAAAQAATTVSVNPVYSNLNLGNPLTVAINISTTDSVYAFDVSVYYDSSILNATALTEGNFLNKDAASTFVGTNTIDNGAGKVQFAVARFGVQTGVSGTGNLFTIDFGTVGGGTSQLGLENIIIVDNNVNPLASTQNNGSAKVNTVPTIVAVVVSPDPAYTVDTLDCGFDVNDPDTQDTVKVDVTWLKNGGAWHSDDENGIVIASWGNTSPQGDIEPSDTVKGNTWVCRVTAYDELSSVSQDSAPVTIQNSLPTQPTVDVTPNSPYTTDSLLCSITAVSTDDDGDGITYDYDWYKNGALQGGLTTNTVNSALTARGQTWKCNVTPNDGTADGPSDDDQVTVLNSKPVATGLGIAPGSPKTTNNLMLSYTYSDADLDPESGTEIKWYKNSVHQPGLNGQLTVPSGSTAKGQQWYATVKPRDGSEFGTLKTSPNVTVQNTVPTVQEVSVKPHNPSDELVCWFRVTDDDNDAVTVDVTWLKDGAPWHSDDENNIPVTLGVLESTSAVGDIESEDLGYQDRWTCQATADDGDDTAQSSNFLDVITEVFASPASGGASVGGNLDVKVEINSTDDVFAVSFNITFNASILNVTAALEGNFLKNDGASTNPIITVDNVGGSISYANTRFGVGTGTNGYGSLLDITFLAKAEGTTVLDIFDLTVVNSGLQMEPSALSDGAVTAVSLLGDVNKDCTVNIFDLAAVGLCYGQPAAGGCENADVHPPGGNGVINIFDLATVGLNYGKSC